MGLAADISLRGFILGIKRVEVLLEPLIGGLTGVNRTADRLWYGLHDTGTFDGLSRSPKNRGPFQRLPVMANATFERLG